ncbi:DGQHR domain-containing protein [Aliarcobacter cryaerophilus]|uniref:DGQHR domain-containing protein n=1 Tax=Aliarcobacter cryaerophilus TaxID=28198 RepID=UPI0021B5C220|nr:DGQHR domain-containing protein [Aliarcobacter cryaerophilus]MCT7473653.1 DGQHR domain-containing protein [Aliarcobacter cryaerophilus]
MNKDEIRVPALKVSQPLGDFYVVSLTAKDLLDVCYSVKAEILEDADENTDTLFKTIKKLTGTQRETKKSRLEQIKNYTETVDASFPNTIILGANLKESGELEKNPEKKWRIEVQEFKNDNGDKIKYYTLVIPSKEPLASIIDGQHRLYGFRDSSKKDMMLVCSVFLNLPMPYHAQIFTNINMNQKKVDRNLAYQLFQFDLNEGNTKTWTPETLAVYFTRVFAEDDDSPFKGKIKLGLSGDEPTTSISMAAVVDGIISLITSNPKIDRETMHSKKLEDGRSRSLLKNISSASPLRQLYIENKDQTFYKIINNYFMVIDDLFWKHVNEEHVFNKTLGIHALFDFLKEITKEKGINFDYSYSFFSDLFNPIKKIQFKGEFFGVQTKLKSRIKNTLLLKSGFKTRQEIEKLYNRDDLDFIESL